MNRELLPPLKRTPVWQRITEAARAGQLLLQECTNCKTTQYPPRELCRHCLQDSLEWREVPAEGTLLSHTTLHASTSPFFSEHIPWRVGLVRLDPGVTVFAHMGCETATTGDRVTLLNRLDSGGAGVFIALRNEEDREAQLERLQAILESSQDS